MDRNSIRVPCVNAKLVALLAEGVDRNFFENCLFAKICKSPSSRRAWIEITSISVAFAFFRVALLAEGVDRNLSWLTPRACCCPSPSSRRAWIEILGYSSGLLPSTSPSSRRAWIEIAMLPPRSLFAPVALLAEGVDRNRPHGPDGRSLRRSPSSRRAWIEIDVPLDDHVREGGRPPRGGRG